MKTFYIAISIEENGKHHACFTKVSENDNILKWLNIKGIKHANIYPTKKRAAEVVDHWNAVYKANGVYMFDSPTF